MYEEITPISTVPAPVHRTGHPVKNLDQFENTHYMICLNKNSFHTSSCGLYIGAFAQPLDLEGANLRIIGPSTKVYVGIRYLWVLAYDYKDHVHCWFKIPVNRIIGREAELFTALAVSNVVMRSGGSMGKEDDRIDIVSKYNRVLGSINGFNRDHDRQIIEVLQD